MIETQPVTKYGQINQDDVLVIETRTGIKITAIIDEKPCVEILQAVLTGWRINDTGVKEIYSRTENFRHILMDGDTLNLQLKVNK